MFFCVALVSYVSEAATHVADAAPVKEGVAGFGSYLHYDVVVDVSGCCCCCCCGRRLVRQSVVLSCFFLASLAFSAFDTLVMRRQKSLASIASKQSALVASLFPQNIHKKLLAEAEEAEIQKRNTIGKAGLKSYLMNNNNNSNFMCLPFCFSYLDFDSSTSDLQLLFHKQKNLLWYIIVFQF